VTAVRVAAPRQRSNLFLARPRRSENIAGFHQDRKRHLGGLSRLGGRGVGQCGRNPIPGLGWPLEVGRARGHRHEATENHGRCERAAPGWCSCDQAIRLSGRRDQASPKAYSRCGAGTPGGCGGDGAAGVATGRETAPFAGQFGRAAAELTHFAASYGGRRGVLAGGRLRRARAGACGAAAGGASSGCRRRHQLPALWEGPAGQGGGRAGTRMPMVGGNEQGKNPHSLPPPFGRGPREARTQRLSPLGQPMSGGLGAKRTSKAIGSPKQPMFRQRAYGSAGPSDGGRSGYVVGSGAAEFCRAGLYEGERAG